MDLAPLALELLRAADEGRVSSGADSARQPLGAWLGGNGGGFGGNGGGFGGGGVGFGGGGFGGGGGGFSGDFGGGGGGFGGCDRGEEVEDGPPPPPSEAQASELAESLLLALGRPRGGEGIQRGGEGQAGGTPPSLRRCLQRLTDAPEQGSGLGPGVDGGGLGSGGVAPLEMLLLHLEVSSKW